MWCDFTILANTLKYLTILDKTWKRSARFDRYACDVTWRRLVSPLAGLDSRWATWSTYVSSDASPRAQNMTMMHILLKIKEHLFHKERIFLQPLSVCLIVCWSWQNIIKKCLFLLLRIFYAICIVLVDSIMKVRATEMCVKRKDQPSDVSMVACGPVCVPAFSPVCVCVSEKQPRKQNQGRQYFSVNQTGHSMAVASFPFLHLSRSPCPIIIE